MCFHEVRMIRQIMDHMVKTEPSWSLNTPRCGPVVDHS